MPLENQRSVFLSVADTLARPSLSQASLCVNLHSTLCMCVCVCVYIFGVDSGCLIEVCMCHM